MQHAARNPPCSVPGKLHRSRSAPASKGWWPLLRRSMSEKMGRSLSDCLLSHRLMAMPEPAAPGGGGNTSTLNLVYAGSAVTRRLATCTQQSVCVRMRAWMCGWVCD
jgi:hypothetical protein